MTQAPASGAGYARDGSFVITVPNAGDKVDLAFTSTTSAFFTSSRATVGATGTLTPNGGGTTAVCDSGGGTTCTVEVGDTTSETVGISLSDETAGAGTTATNLGFNGVYFAACEQTGVDTTSNCVSQAQTGVVATVAVRYLQGGGNGIGIHLTATLDNNAFFPPSQPNGSAEASQQVANCTTDTSGSCRFSVVDNNATPENVDFEIGAISPPGYPNAFGDQLIHVTTGSVSPARLDLVSSTLIAPATQSSTFQDFAEPGDAVQNTYAVTGGCTPTSGASDCEGIALANVDLAVSVDHGFFTPNCTNGHLTQYGMCSFSTPPAVGATTGNLLNAGTSQSVHTDNSGDFIVTLGIARDMEFDDDGLVVAKVTASTLRSQSPGTHTTAQSCPSASVLQPQVGSTVTPDNLAGCPIDTEWSTQEQPLNGGEARLVSVATITTPPNEFIPSANNAAAADGGGSAKIPDVQRVDFLAHITDQFDNLTNDAGSGANQPTLTKTGPGSLYGCTGVSSTSACTGGALAGTSTPQPDGTTEQELAVVGSYLDVPDQVRFQADTNDGSINLRYPCDSRDAVNGCQAVNTATPGVNDGTQTEVLSWATPTTTFRTFISGGIATYAAGVGPTQTDTLQLDFYDQLATPVVSVAVSPSSSVPTSTTATVAVTVTDGYGNPIVDQTASFGRTGSNASSCTPATTQFTDTTGAARYAVTCTSAGTLTVSLAVSSQQGTQYGSALESIKYGAPAVTSISPGSGPMAGGNTVTINGTGFSGAAKVAFGSVGTATSYTVVSATKITAVVPATSSAGLTVHVTVTTPNGTSPKVAADVYRYAPVPAVTSISPASGPMAGGTTVTITGTGFTGATKVTFGSAGPAATYAVVSDTKITATAPAGASGLSVHVTITTPGGTSAKVTPDIFKYNAPAPTVSSISPSSGPVGGGTTVTITGTGFTGATKVTFGSAGSATSYTVVSGTTITAVSPATTTSGLSVHVTVTAAGGTSPKTTADVYKYTAG